MARSRAASSSSRQAAMRAPSRFSLFQGNVEPAPSCFVLSWGDLELRLPEGAALVGSDPECDIVIADAGVSPQHARVVASSDGLSVDSLGGAGAICVNGVPVAGETRLSPGDRLTLGDVVLAVVARDLSDPEDPGRPTLIQTPPALAAVRLEQERRTVLRLLESVMDKALATDSLPEFATTVSRQLEEIAADCAAGRPVSADVVSAASRCALKLADATHAGQWVNWLVRIYLARAEVIPRDFVDALYRMLRHTEGVDWRQLRDYAELLRSRNDRMSPAERFATRRIGGLLQLGPG